MWGSRGIRMLAVLLVAVSTAAPVEAQADPYLSAIADHFEVPASELGILAEWPIPADEIPVVLFVAERGGASRDALLALRRRGSDWATIAGRYGLHAGSFHFAIPGSPAEGVLRSTYEAFGGRERATWPSIALEDAQIIALVNLRFLTEHLELDGGRVADALARASSAAEALQRLGGEDR